MTEGISIGFYDKNGYNNAYPSEDVIDYLCLGSSQMEAKEVMPNKNMVYFLNEILDSNGETGYAYNIGVSGEQMTTCISRLGHAVETYCPQRAVIIETGALDFSQNEIDEALEDPEVGNLFYTYRGIMGIVRKLPYIRLVYVQLELLQDKKKAETAAVVENDTVSEFDYVSYKTKITPLIEKAEKNAKGIPVIIFYHPGVTIQTDGSLSTGGDPAMIRCFRDICEANGVRFLDMSERFQREYYENYTVPYGFANTRVASGHLNRYGHAMIADELYKMIQEVE
jgi:hypothetical protein